MEKLKPLGDNVLLSHEAEQQTNGIIIPRGQSDRSHIMRVVSSGQNKELKPGDRVIVAKYAGTEIVMGTEKFLLVCEYDVLGKIEEVANG